MTNSLQPAVSPDTPPPSSEAISAPYDTIWLPTGDDEEQATLKPNHGNGILEPTSSRRLIQDGIEACDMLKRRGKRRPYRQRDFGDSTNKSTEQQEKAIPTKPNGHSTVQAEQDFTISGRQGNLGCPFATMGKPSVRSPKSSRVAGDGSVTHLVHDDSFEDPMAMEFHSNEDAGPPDSVTGSIPKCPIRYLDQHSPEEVAKYFENHKHEIPRSHEICVKRYQSNEAGIRRLDAKYGSLVNMIQGLGVKHQPLLPTDEDDETAHLEEKSIMRVKSWQQAFDDKAMNSADCPQPSDQSDGSEDRDGRFDRPLKEVRVGESPSRPWGIQVPLTEREATDTDILGEVKSAPTPRPTSNKPGEYATVSKACPFGHGNSLVVEDGHQNSTAGPRINAPTVDQKSSDRSTGRKGDLHVDSDRRTGQHGVYFTGPVFIGYPADQAAVFLQQYSQGANAAEM